MPFRGPCSHASPDADDAKGVRPNHTVRGARVTVTVTTEGFEFTIGTRPIQRVRLHEEVVHHHVDGLVDAVEADGELRDPVIIDAATDTVLDGMHRVTAAARLGLTHIPACLVDYEDPAIRVGSWAKVFDAISLAEFEAVCGEHGIDLEPVAHPPWGCLRGEPIAASGATYFSLAGVDGDPEAVCSTMAMLFDEVGASGGEGRLESDAYLNGSLGEDELALAISPPSKRTVVEVARSPFFYPPNTTRHVLPARPIRLDVPLDVLDGDEGTATGWLDERVSTATLSHLPAGSEYGGRTYDEALVVFER